MWQVQSDIGMLAGIQQQPSRKLLEICDKSPWLITAGDFVFSVQDAFGFVLKAAVIIKAKIEAKLFETRKLRVV